MWRSAVLSWFQGHTPGATTQKRYILAQTSAERRKDMRKKSLLLSQPRHIYIAKRFHAQPVGAFLFSKNPWPCSACPAQHSTHVGRLAYLPWLLQVEGLTCCTEPTALIYAHFKSFSTFLGAYAHRKGSNVHTYP